MTNAQIPHMEPVDAEFEENTAAQQETQIEKDILAEFQADGSAVEWRVKVKKVDERTKKQDDCFEISPSEIRGVAERLDEEYGPGEYRLYVMRADKLKYNLRLGIAKRRQRATPSDSTSSAFQQIGHILERQNEQLANIMQGVAPGAAPAPSNPMEMMQGMVAMMVQMKEFLQPAGGGEKHGSVSEFMELWTFARELAQERGGGGDSNVADIVRELIQSPITGELVETLRQNRQKGIAQQRQAALSAPAPAASQPVASAPPASSPQTTAPPRDEPRPSFFDKPEIPGTMRPGGAPAAQPAGPFAGNDGAGSGAGADPIAANGDAAAPTAALAELDPSMRAMLKNVVDHWVTRAEAGSDPGLYAEVAIDNYPVEIIRAVLLREDLREQATALNPAAGVQWDWFADLIAELKHLLTQAEREAQQSGDVREQSSAAAPATLNGDSERSGGDRGDAFDHGGAGAAGPEKPHNPGESG